MKRLHAFLSSMGGRLFFILLSGMLAAAVVATLLVNVKRRQDAAQQNLTRDVDRLQGYVELLEGGHAELRSRLLDLGGPGIRQATTAIDGRGDDPEFQRAMQARGGALERARASLADPAQCRPAIPGIVREAVAEAASRRRPRSDDDGGAHRCRVISLALDDGTPLTLTLDTPPRSGERLAPFDTLFIGLLALAIAVLAYVVARIASAPLARLAQAASALGRDLQHAPMALSGPTEVRAAATAFNAMQERLQRHVGERTQMLAAITHDLQTPLTRLRLRLENVADDTLRQRLIGDLAAMQALIREGLELARSAESSEQPVPLDLDSLLESLVEDVTEAGGAAHFEGGCGAVLMLRPLAMHRVFSNLIQNGLNYGHSVRVASSRSGDRVIVHVRDNGPGLLEDQLLAVLDPFVRLETSRSRDSGGTGLGLAIARSLAEKDGATLTLRNHPEGGLDAMVEWEHPAFVP